MDNIEEIEIDPADLAEQPSDVEEIEIDPADQQVDFTPESAFGKKLMGAASRVSRFFGTEPIYQTKEDGSIEIMQPEYLRAVENEKQLRDLVDVSGEVLTEGGKGVALIAQKALKPLQKPANFIASGATRGLEGFEQYLTNKETRSYLESQGLPVKEDDLGSVIDKVLNPEVIALSREREGKSGDFKKLLAEAQQKGSWDTVKFFLEEAFPDVTMGDYVRSNKESFKQMGYSDEQIATLGFGADLGFDPLTWSKFISRVPNKTSEAILADKGLTEYEKARKLLDIAGDGAEDVLRPWGALAREGKMNLLEVKVPGLPALNVKGAPVLDVMDFVGTQTRRLPFVPSVLTRTGIQGADAIDYSYEFRRGADEVRLNELAERFKNFGAVDEKVMQYASNLAEFGYKEGAVLSRKIQNIKLTSGQLRQAREIAKLYDEVTVEGARAFQRATGTDLTGKIKELSPEEQGQILKDLTKNVEGTEVPRLIVRKGGFGNGLDFTFSKNYDYGRMLTEEAMEARALHKNAQNFATETARDGLMTSPSAARDRSRLSGAFYENMLKEQLGVGKAFEANKTQVVLNKYRQLTKSARDIEYIDALKTRFGSTVKHDGYRTLDSKKFNSLSAITKTKTINKGGEAKEIAETVFFDKNIYYPREVADMIEARFFEPPQEGIIGFANWLYSQKSKNMLTSPYRIPKQAVDNFAKAMALGVKPDAIAKEMFMAGTGKKDAITIMADALPSVNETLLDLRTWMPMNQKIKVNELMLSETPVPVSSFIRSFKDYVKTSGWKKLSTDAIKAPVRLMNDNPVSSFIRRAGNYSDGLTRRAYFRTLIEKNYDPAQAAIMVGDGLMDFSRQQKAVQGLKWVTPFAAFKLKNLESLPYLLAARPSIASAVNPYDGYLKKALEDNAGWNPDATEALQRIDPFHRDAIVAYIFRGDDEIVANPNLMTDFVNTYASALMGRDVSQGGFMRPSVALSLTLPTYIQAATDITKLNDKTSEMSPFMAAAGLSVLGYDIFKGQKLDSLNDDIIGRLTLAAREINPMDYERFYNMAVMPVLREVIPEVEERLAGNEVGQRLATIMKLRTGKGFKPSDMALDRYAVNQMVSLMTGGMGHLTDSSLTFLSKQAALTKRYQELTKQIEKPPVSGMGKEGVNYFVKRHAELLRIKDKFEFNAKLWEDLTAAYDNMAVQLKESPEGQQQLQELSLGLEADENATEAVEAPFDDSIEVDEEDWVEDDQLDGGREPQGSFDMQTSSPLINAGSSKTKEKMFPLEAERLNITQGAEADALVKGLEEGAIPVDDTEWMEFEDVPASMDRVPQSQDPVYDAINKIRDFEIEQSILAESDLSTPEGAQQAFDTLVNFFQQRIEKEFGDKSPQFKQDLLETIKQEFYDANRLATQGSGSRMPAAERAFSELGMGGGSNPGAAALGLGAASMLPLLEGEEPPSTPEVEQQKTRQQDVEAGLGSRLLKDPEYRRLYNMTPEQLAEEPAGEKRDRVLEIKGLEKIGIGKNPGFRFLEALASPMGEYISGLGFGMFGLPGYTIVDVEGNTYEPHLDEPDYKERQEVEKKIRREFGKENYYISGPVTEWTRRRLGNELYDRINVRMQELLKENPKSGYYTDSWTRAYAPNPDTFLVFEAQRNKKSKKSSEKDALARAYEYAKKAGYKYVAIVDAPTAAEIQGHGEVADWIHARYNVSYPSFLEKITGSKGIEKQTSISGQDLPLNYMAFEIKQGDKK